MPRELPQLATVLGERPGRESPATPCQRPQSFSAFAAHDRGGSMATGTVKWFNDDKGFGFISPDEPGKDLFVHHTGIVSDGCRPLAEGAGVSYESEAGPKGPKAVNFQAL